MVLVFVLVMLGLILLIVFIWDLSIIWYIFFSLGSGFLIVNVLVIFE